MLVPLIPLLVAAVPLSLSSRLRLEQKMLNPVCAAVRRCMCSAARILFSAFGRGAGLKFPAKLLKPAPHGANLALWEERTELKLQWEEQWRMHKAECQQLDDLRQDARAYTSETSFVYCFI